MENKVKKWIEAEYRSVKHVLESVSSISPCVKNEFIHDSIERAYGVMMFAINNLFDDYNEELGEWWENEMLPKFKELKSLLTNEY